VFRSARRTRSVLHIFVDGFGLHRRGVDRAVGIDGDTFRRREFRVGHRWRRDVVVDLSRLHAANAHAALAAGIVSVLARRIFGFRIGHVENIILIDPDAARPAKLFPRGEKFAVPIENVDAAVATVGDEEAPLRIEGEHMGALQFAVA
jgi:hypothetical protein